jgi:hypothetical protein
MPGLCGEGGDARAAVWYTAVNVWYTGCWVVVQRLLRGLDTHNARLLVVVVCGVLLGLYTLQSGVITDALEELLHTAATTSHRPTTLRQPTPSHEDHPEFDSYLRRWQAALEHSQSASEPRLGDQEHAEGPLAASAAPWVKVTAAPPAPPPTDGHAAEASHTTPDPPLAPSADWPPQAQSAAPTLAAALEVRCFCALCGVSEPSIRRWCPSRRAAPLIGKT